MPKKPTSIIELGGKDRSKTKQQKIYDEVFQDLRERENSNEFLNEAKDILTQDAQLEKGGERLVSQAKEQLAQEAETERLQEEKIVQEQLKVLRGEQDEAKKTLQAVIAKTNKGVEDFLAQPTNPLENSQKESNETIQEEQEEQKIETDRKEAEEIQNESERFEQEKEGIKQKYHERIETIQNGPPAHIKFFLGKGLFRVLWAADSIISLLPIPFVATAIELVFSLIVAFFYFIPALLMGAIFSGIIITVLYLIDAALSTVFSVVASFIPGVGDIGEAVLDAVPELLFTGIGAAPYQLLERQVDQYQQARVERAGDTLRIEMKHATDAHKRRIEKIKARYGRIKNRLRNFFANSATSLPRPTQSFFTALVTIAGAYLAWIGVLGVTSTFNILTIIFTAFAALIYFFLGKMGVVRA